MSSAIYPIQWQTAYLILGFELLANFNTAKIIGSTSLQLSRYSPT